MPQPVGPPTVPPSLFADDGGRCGMSEQFTIASPEQALRYVQQATEYNKELVNELTESPGCNDLGSAMLQYLNTRARRTVAFIPGGPEANPAWSNSISQICQLPIQDPPTELVESVGILFTAMDKTCEMVERLKPGKWEQRGASEGTRVERGE